MFLIVFITSLCIGSFLNVLSTRILHGKKLFTMRSLCPSCENVIAWYDNIPLISFIVLRGQCRSCRASISLLYPLTELIAACVLTAIFYATEPHAFLAYGLFFCALISATRTDLEAMLIPQLFTIWLVPLGLIAAYGNFIDITLPESILGSISGYGILWLLAFIFKRYAKKDGMGVGDMELLALIGSFLGPIGIWIVLMIASFFGLIIGSTYLILSGKRASTRVPFGPFLAFGALAYFFFKEALLNFLLGF